MGTTSLKADFYARAEQRIGWLTLGLGLAAALVTGVLVSGAAAAGVTIGALLAWVSYRWLREAAHALTRLSAAQAQAEKPRVSPWLYVRFFARYALIGLVLYVMVARFAVPMASLLGGMLALGAAAMVEGIYEIIFGSR